jgi:endonuclease III
MTSFISAGDLGIDMSTDQGLFDWLLASILFGRPVPQETAASAFRQFKDDGWDAPDRFTAEERGPLWHELYAGNYHRMSSVMARELPEVMRGIIDQYGGSVARLVHTASSREEVSQRLQSFNGIGPKTAEIFLREVPDAAIGTA